jgi:hypothetical protein
LKRRALAFASELDTSQPVVVVGLGWPPIVDGEGYSTKYFSVTPTSTSLLVATEVDVPPIHVTTDESADFRVM